MRIRKLLAATMIAGAVDQRGGRPAGAAAGTPAQGR